MTTEEKIHEIDKKLNKIKRSGDIQTFFLVLVFVFGITSISELMTKVNLKKVMGGKI
jgi:hypothetical protein